MVVIRIKVLLEKKKAAFTGTCDDNQVLGKLEKAAVNMREGESVYDYQWYPLMNSRAPETCCLVTTSQHQPIHLYDAFDGHIRATYRYDSI